jgi:hypothetical protein
VFRISVAVIAAIIAGSAFSSLAEARSGGSFYASPFFRNQGMKPAVDPSIELRRRSSEEAANARARRLEAARREAAREAAAARRARALAQERAQSEKAATANTAPVVPQTVPQTTASTSEVTSVAKREDRLPSAVADAPTTKTATAAPTTTASTQPSEPARVCRKYSAAANGIIEAPCN